MLLCVPEMVNGCEQVRRVAFHVKQTAIGRRIHGRRAVAKGEGTGHIGGRCPHAARSFVHLPARTLEEAAV